jgi:5-methylcytosine-specific restriction endonuclease McrA
MKEEILKLRKEGKSYNEIKEILGCSKGTIAYHCGNGQKEKQKDRGSKWKEKNPLKVKLDNLQNRAKTNFRKKVGDYKRRVGYNIDPVVESDIASYKEVEKLFKESPVCYLTGTPIDINDPSSYHIDHYIPTSKGGSNDISNLRFATKAANKAKDELLFEDFLNLCKTVLTYNGFNVEEIGGS